MNDIADRLGRATDGERGHLLAYVIVTIAGALMTFLIVTRLESPDRPMFTTLSGYEIWVTVSGGIGAIAALYLTGELMGQPGKSGFFHALRGVLLLSFAGSLISGTFALPLYGTMFGPFSLVVTVIGSPILGVLWFGSLFAAHFLMIRYRRERQSIWVPLDDLPKTQRRRSTSPLRKSSVEDQGWLDDEEAALAALRYSSAPNPGRSSAGAGSSSTKLRDNLGAGQGLTPRMGQ